MTKAYAQRGDFVRKDGDLVRIQQIDRKAQTYFTSDGGVMGFDEVTADTEILLESEVYDELGGNIPPMER